MSLIGFTEQAGEELLGSAGGSGETSAASAALERHLAAHHLRAGHLSVTYDVASRTVTVKGIASDEAAKEKIVLCCGNVQGVAKVDDQLTVVQESPAYPSSAFYEVKEGDSLDKIANAVYGEPNTDTIFEANKPMLKNPDRIYPGQKLRIPPKA